MKLYSTFSKLPLIALLSLGLACSPLVVSADDDNRGRHSHYQKDHDNSHHRADHSRDYRDYGHRHNYGYRNSCRKDYKHGYKKAVTAMTGSMDITVVTSMSIGTTGMDTITTAPTSCSACNPMT